MRANANQCDLSDHMHNTINIDSGRAVISALFTLKSQLKVSAFIWKLWFYFKCFSGCASHFVCSCVNPLRLTGIGFSAMIRTLAWLQSRKCIDVLIQSEIWVLLFQTSMMCRKLLCELNVVEVTDNK